MNNEPIAWINLEKWKDTSSYLEDCVADMKLESAGIVTPLYTHPAKESDSTKIASKKEFWECYSKVCSENHPAKTLTDKEILELWDWDSGEILATDLLDFADAILRKAQDK